jgi:ABC-2 type transport system permease protein
MTGLNKLPALLKREILEHKNLWRVPAILIGIAILVKLSLSIGNLSLDINIPDQLQLDDDIDSALNVVVAKALNSMNYIIMLVMFVVAIFYSLSCLFNERQDESVLFWRSLPISDSITVASKMLIALVAVPIVIIASQAVVAVVFFGTSSPSYLSSYYGGSLMTLGKFLLWSMLPIIAWCMFCSEIAKKNPFLLAFIAPILFIVVDKLFLNGVVSQTFVINRLTGISNYTLMALVWGVLFSAVCVVLALVKRSQRI